MTDSVFRLLLNGEQVLQWLTETVSMLRRRRQSAGADEILRDNPAK